MQLVAYPTHFIPFTIFLTTHGPDCGNGLGLGLSVIGLLSQQSRRQSLNPPLVLQLALPLTPRTERLRPSTRAAMLIGHQHLKAATYTTQFGKWMGLQSGGVWSGDLNRGSSSAHCCLGTATTETAANFDAVAQLQMPSGFTSSTLCSTKHLLNQQQGTVSSCPCHVTRCYEFRSVSKSGGS